VAFFTWKRRRSLSAGPGGC